MRLIYLALISALIFMNCMNNSTIDNRVPVFTVKKIGELPASGPGVKNAGVAGAFAGVFQNRLIVAGGSNFPDKAPWEGGTKVFYDKIYGFEILDDTLKTIKLSASLPQPLAYGSSLSMPEGILCIGGNGPVQCSSKVFLIKLDEKAKTTEIIQYPELPVPLSFSTAVLSGNKVYVTGGSSMANGADSVNHFFSLDLSLKKSSDFKWERLPSYPGMSRILSVAAVQSNGTRECIYLFGGRNVSNPEKPVVFNDGLVFDPFLQKWEKVQASPVNSFPVMAGSAFPYSDKSIVFVGGAPDSTFMKEAELKNALASSVSSRDDEMAGKIRNKMMQFYREHKGFSKRIFAFNTVTCRVTESGSFVATCPVTTTAITYKDGAIIACGEVRPGIRTPDIFRIQVAH